VTDALDDLIALLDLETIEKNIFRGTNPDGQFLQRIFGGQVAGQALVAAGRTVSPERHVHSLHAYFLRPGDPSAPVLYDVDRIRDGRSFTTRRVVAIQHGQAIFNLSASFQVVEAGQMDHQLPMPPAPDPESLPTFAERYAARADEPGTRTDAMNDWYTRPRPIDSRYVEPRAEGPNVKPRPPRQQVWFRANGTLQDDHLLHAVIVAYASDMSLLDSTLLPHGVTWEDPRITVASLDHAMWFHRRFRADEWLLYDQESTSSGGARGFARGEIFRRDGVLAVSVVQEGLVRFLPALPEPGQPASAQAAPSAASAEPQRLDIGT
jgi:acyl-CoA thioesterase-2